MLVGNAVVLQNPVCGSTGNQACRVDIKHGFQVAAMLLYQLQKKKMTTVKLRISGAPFSTLCSVAKLSLCHAYSPFPCH
jgi:hypothetical protein